MTRPRKVRCGWSPAPGYTLAELLVAMTIMSVVLALSFPVFFSAREMVQSDQLRTSVNQNIRGGSDLIGGDIRMAGERFPRGSGLQLEPIQIVLTAGKADELILRRNLWESTLPICDELPDGSTAAQIQVVRDSAWLADTIATPPGVDFPECGQPVDSVGTEAWPKNLNSLRALADSIGVSGVLRGYIFDPSTNVGEFIDFSVEDNAYTTLQITRSTTTPLANAYPLENRARIYVLEERRYRLEDDIIELIINEDDTNALQTTSDIENMQVRFVMADGSVVSALPSGSTWRDIRSVQLTLTGSMDRGPENVSRELTSRYFPRNILSR